MVNKKYLNSNSEDESLVSKILVLLKGLVLGMLISFILIVLYSILLSYTSMSDSSMGMVTQIIMILSITISSIYCAKTIKNKGWLFGLLIGILYIILLIPISSVFGQISGFDKLFLIKLALGSIVGVIGGIIGVNIA